MKKIIIALMLSVSFMFASIDVQTASKAELMSIKGIGSKKADSIIKYRKSNKLRTADDLKNIKGIGKSIVNNVKNDVKGGGKKATKQEKKASKQEKSAINSDAPNNSVEKKSKKRVKKSKDNSDSKAKKSKQKKVKKEKKEKKKKEKKKKNKQKEK